VGLANGRCDQENVIEQLKNGVNAMWMPVNDLVSKLGLHGDGRLGLESQGPRYGLLTPTGNAGWNYADGVSGASCTRIVLLPCQIVRTAARSLPVSLTR